MTTGPSQARRTKPDWLYPVFWIILPTIAFGYLYILGHPFRTQLIVAYMLLGVVSAFKDRLIYLLVIAVVLAADLLFSVTTHYGFAPLDFLVALKYAPMMEYSDGTSTFALPFVVLSACIALLGWLHLRTQPAQPRRAAIYILVAGLLAISAETVYRPNPFVTELLPADKGVDVAMTSAMSQIDDIRDARSERPADRILFIMMESLGAYSTKERETAVFQPLLKLADEGFSVDMGRIAFHGHTTDGEIREFCDTAATYLMVMEHDEALSGCRPFQWAADGYQVTSLHGSPGALFERKDWYHLIGFENDLWRRDFLNRQYELCIGPFPGPCDFPMLQNEVRPRLAAEGKQAVYFLTLTSHLPFVHISEGPFDCAGDDQLFGAKQVCNLSNYFHSFFADVASIARDMSDEDLEIILVGDHSAPFMQAAERANYTEGMVPWIRVRSRAKKAVPTAAPGG